MMARMPAVFLVLFLSTTILAAPPDSKKADKKKPRRAVGKSKQESKKKRSSARRPRNMAVKAMRMVIEDAEFVDMTFDEFTEWLARSTGANVLVRWNVLDEQGVERDHPIKLKQKKIVVRELLARVFRIVTEELPSVELAAKAEGNTLLISTRKDINAKRFTRAYDVQHLLLAVPHFKSSKIDDLGLGEDGRLRLQKAPVTRDRRGRNVRVRQLIELITTHVQPSSWKVNGGKGTIRHFKGRLIVYNNIEVHQQLGGTVGPK